MNKLEIKKQDLPKKTDILRRLFDNNHIDLQELLVLLTEKDEHQVAIQLTEKNFKDFSSLYILK